MHLFLNLHLPRRQLRKAVVDHVSDSFLEPDAPLHLLIAAAKEGNEREVDEHAQVSTVCEKSKYLDRFHIVNCNSFKRLKM